VTAAVSLPPPALEPEHVRRVVQEVLSRPEYDPLRPTLLERVLSWLGDQLGRLLERFAGGAADLAAWLVILAVLAVAVALGLWLLRRLRPDPSVPDPLTGPAMPPEDWAADADRLERAGRWREALRCRYRELIAELAASGVVEEAPGRTTGEYLAQIRNELPEAAGPAAALTEAFEEVWYGNRTAGPEDVAALRADANQVRSRAAAGVR
jgi:hypothetical protein